MQLSNLLPGSLSSKARYTPKGTQPFQFKFPGASYSNIDDYLSKIGFGLYQIRVYLILGFVLINDGAEVIVLSFLMAILSKEWDLNSAEIGFVGSAVFAGVFVGSLFTGKISDIYGRKKALIYVVLLLYIFAMWSAFVESYFMLVFVRTLFGLLVGFQFPMCFTYLAEITPKEVRGKYLVLAGGFFTIGELLACFIGFFTLDSSNSGNWRALFVWVAQPALISCLGIIYLMHESPRYEIVVRKDYKEGLRIIGTMAIANGVGIELNEEDEDNLKQWVEKNHQFQENETASYLALFRGKSKTITLFLWPVWMILSLVYYGMVYILPMTLASLRENEDDIEEIDTLESENDLWAMVIAVLSELPSIAVGYLVIEKSIMGRKNSILFGFLVCGLACLLAGVSNSLVFWIAVARSIVNCVFIIAPAYTTELYATNIRTTGLGMASAASRVGGVIMPWITMGLFSIAPTLPYVGFCLFCGIGAVCCYMIPIDTTNKELDFELEETPKQKGDYLVLPE